MSDDQIRVTADKAAREASQWSFETGIVAGMLPTPKGGPQGVRGGVAVPTAEFPKINKEAEVVKKAFRIERLAHVQAAILFLGFFVYAVFLLCR
jgi:hypothetical protein